MKEKHIQILGLILTVIYGFFVAWLYWAEPKNLEEVSTKAKETIENTTTKAQVITGTYEVDAAKFADGLKAFRADNFVAARQFFENADPEHRDAKTQFYIAYSFYRQGFGKLYSDDELFKKGLEQTNRVIALDRNFKSDDADLKMQTPAELKNEFEEGLRVTAEDFNPMKLTRERK
jgi:hypothetical protein